LRAGGNGRLPRLLRRLLAGTSTDTSTVIVAVAAVVVIIVIAVAVAKEKLYRVSHHAAKHTPVAQSYTG